ncbi:MAG TPA: AAA family ATPase [Alphaproteobacteria bacterium]|nr:AAA family ATPase [Alphaproteobacteria bacterium]
MPSILIVTGPMAAGKSTVAQALAERLPKSVHLRGDMFRRMIVGGRVEKTPDAAPEAIRQLELRYGLGAAVAGSYAEAGFTVVYQDIILGDHLRKVVALLRARDPGVVVLSPPPGVTAARDRARSKTAYGQWTPGGLDAVMRAETPRMGLWIDNSTLSVDRTVDFILEHSPRTREGVSA